MRAYTTYMIQSIQYLGTNKQMIELTVCLKVDRVPTNDCLLWVMYKWKSGRAHQAESRHLLNNIRNERGEHH